MKFSLSLKAAAVAIVLGSFAVAGAAKAYDDHHDDAAGEVFLGIIGQIAEGAVERHEARRQYREFDHYCGRLQQKCDWGEGWACRKYWRECDYE